MHELSIALNIIEIAENEAIKAMAKKINQVEIEIGTLSGIEIEALSFAIEAAKNDTSLKDTVFNLTVVHAEGLCNDCQFKFMLANIYSNCPECSSYDISFHNGKELKVKSISVD